MKILFTTLLLVSLYHSEIHVGAAIFEPNYIQNHLGARTPYSYVSNKNDTQIKYPGCKEVKIWMFIRHGTRLPNVKCISASVNEYPKLKDEILLQHAKGKGELTEEQLLELEEWVPKITVDKQKAITREGEEEMVLLAERMKNRFPKIFNKSYDNKTYSFSHSVQLRAYQSAKQFAIGLFGKQDVENVDLVTNSEIDRVLRCYKHCYKWQKEIKQNPEAYKEQTLYSISQDMNETLIAVSKRLGLSRVLSFGTVSTLYKMCGFETAWEPHHLSPWCNIFDEKTIQVLEYYYDVKSHIFDGYGHELSRQHACISMKHMLDTFRNEGEPGATFLFSHLGAVLKLVSYLGLFKPDSPLTSTNVVKDSKWRNSEIGAFSSNLAFVLYRCEEGDKVLTLYQEKIVRLPMCSEDLCPLHTLIDYAKECDFDEICKVHNHTDL